MKRTHQPHDEFSLCLQSIKQPKRLKGELTLPDVLDILNNAKLSADDLLQVGAKISLLYSLKANSIIQNLPTDLWAKILALISPYHVAKAWNDLPLLQYRLVCKSWLFAISKVRTLTIGLEYLTIGDYLSLFHLKSLAICPTSQIMDFSYIQHLRKLTITENLNMPSFNDVANQWEDLSMLTDLTSLHIGTKTNISEQLLFLTNLKILELRRPVMPVAVLNCLTSLESLTLKRHGYLGSAVERLTRLTTLKSDSAAFFQRGKGIVIGPGNSYEHDGEWSNGLANGPGVVRYTNGVVFQGYFSNGHQVKGIETHPDWVYEGTYDRNQKHGPGKLTWLNPPDGKTNGVESQDGEWEHNVFRRGTVITTRGQVLKGEFDHSLLLNGQGSTTEPDGAHYEGHWLSGSRHHEGEQTEPNGDIYRGTFAGDLPCGRGVLKYNHHGRYYCGGFKGGTKIGSGEQRWNSGASLVGDWVGRIVLAGLLYGGYNRPSGWKAAVPCCGQVTTEDGEYDGEYLHYATQSTNATGLDFPHGKGVMMYTNGESYSGDWHDGIPHGQGTLTSKHGSYAGGWEYGDQTGDGVLQLPNGTCLIGSFVNGLLHGAGSQEGIRERKRSQSSNILSAEGQWEHGLLHGHGTLNIQDGTSYSGEMKHDQPHGQGTMQKADGKRFVGQWEDGNFVTGTLVSADGKRQREGCLDPSGQFRDLRERRAQL